ncbi:MAG: hypothetical protein LBP59_11030 [Planctomycetaceae bacterium]|jgi:hypothetical protein|nr:hypothetical protein [Planctomycetaceae bacterium]
MNNNVANISLFESLQSGQSGSISQMSVFNSPALDAVQKEIRTYVSSARKRAETLKAKIKKEISEASENELFDLETVFQRGTNREWFRIDDILRNDPTNEVALKDKKQWDKITDKLYPEAEREIKKLFTV